MAKKMKLDFTGIEAYVKCAEGQHKVKLTEIEETESQAGNPMLNPMLNATFQVVSGASTGAKLYDNFVLTEKALWKLQSFLVAVGMKADGRVTLDLDNLIGKTCIVEVAHEEYEGKTRARIQEFIKLQAKVDEDAEDEADDEDEEEAPAPKKPVKTAVKSKKKPDDEFEDDEWEDDED